MITTLVVSATLLAAIGFAHTKSTWYNNNKIKYQWNKLMKEKKIENYLGETFEVKDASYMKGFLTIEVTVPPGLTIDKLEECKKNLEYILDGDIHMLYDKYRGHILITADKNTKQLSEMFRNRWIKILSEKTMEKGLFHSKITYVDVKDKTTYEILINPNSEYKYESLESLKNRLEAYLTKETIDKIDLFNNKIKLLIRKKR